MNIQSKSFSSDLDFTLLRAVEPVGNHIGLTDLHGMYALSEILARDVSAHLNIKDRSVERVRRYGILAARHKLPSRIPDEDIMASRRKINHIVLNNPLDVDQCARLMNWVLDKLRDDAGNGQMPRAEAQETLSVAFRLPRNQEWFSLQWVHWYLNHGNIIPLTWWTNEWAAILDAFEQRGDMVIDADAIPQDVQPVTAINWGELLEETRMGLYEIHGRSVSQQGQQALIGANLLEIFSIIKGENLTEQWLEKRMTRYLNKWPGLRISDIVTVDNVALYSTLYPRDNLTPADIYNMLNYLNTFFSACALEPMKWVIAQSFFMNVTSLNALATMLSKSAKYPIDALINVVSMEQIRKACELVCHLLHDKCCSYIKPPVTISDYPDLAFVADFTEFILNRPTNSTTTYNGKPDMKATKPKAFLESAELR